MPPVNPSSSKALFTMLQSLLSRVTALETQQNGGVRDASGILRVAWGLLTSGDYGLRVADVNGNATEFLPVYFEQETTTLSVGANQTNVDLGFPALEVVVGASGNVEVTVSSFVELPLTSSVAGGFIGVSIDGATPTGVLAGCCGLEAANSSAAQGSQSVTLLVTGVSKGSHSFKCLYSGLAGGAGFLNTYLKVQPV